MKFQKNVLADTRTMFPRTWTVKQRPDGKNELQGCCGLTVSSEEGLGQPRLPTPFNEQ